MKILYLLDSYNIYGGTPKKTLDLMGYFGKKSVLYVYNNAHGDKKKYFEKTDGKIFEGFYGKNIFIHIRVLIKIIDSEDIDIVQTQFSMGETLGFLIKLFRPKVKLIIAFVGALKPTPIKSIFVNIVYKKTVFFIYISKYVKSVKIKQFPLLTNKRGQIIFNGAEIKLDNGNIVPFMKNYSLFAVSGLIELKNIQMLIEALNILINNIGRKDIFLYVAGDGPYRKQLENMIKEYGLQNYILLMGYQSNVGKLLKDCDIFVHPSYAEGFGIAVAEAMMAEKPIIVANAGALPELIEHEKSGLVIDPYKSQKWADAILKLIENPMLAKKIAKNAKIRAEKLFSVKHFCEQYESLYKTLLSE